MNGLSLDLIKGVIFDLDGVIFDITKSIRNAVEDAINKYNIKVEIEEVLQEVAHLIEDLQNYPVPKIILNSYDLLKVKFLDGFSFFKKLRVGIYLFNQFNKYKENAGIFDGIDRIIFKLNEMGKKLAILTNNKSTYAQEVLDKFNLKKYFDLIIGFNDVSEVKPSPEGINIILKKWNFQPSEVIFIGDMTTDIIAGKSARVNTIAIASGLAKKEVLKNNNPNYLVNDTLELKKLLKL